jgi:hypothetical protein
MGTFVNKRAVSARHASLIPKPALGTLAAVHVHFFGSFLVSLLIF